MKAAFVIAAFSLYAVVLGGWVANIVRMVSCDWVLSGEEVLRIVGIFVVPLGSVLGFIGHF